MNEDILIKSSKESKVKTEFDLGELVKLEMIKRRTDMMTGGVRMNSFTKEDGFC